jgi:hypothetical protein
MRDKGSEWKAMNAFLRTGALPFTPLIEAVCEPYDPQNGVPKNPVSVLGVLGTKLPRITDSGRLWVDLGHLTRAYSAADVAEFHTVVRRNLGLASSLVTPVVRTSSPPEVLDAVFAWAREEGSGLCIRVDGATHLTAKAELVRSISSSSGVANQDIDLVCDAQDLPRAVSHDQLRETFALSQTARVWAVVGGTFPKGITDMQPDDYEHRRERGEWIAWRDEIAQGGMWRAPIYGDYATQPAIYTPSRAFPGSPSVRYTIGEDYVILRGRGGSGETAADYGQYIGHALYLRQQPYFREIIESPADRYIEQIASRTFSTGNLTTWRVASIQRHLYVVAAQVGRLTPVRSRSR